MPRVTPITSKTDLAPEHHALADAVVQTFGHIRGPFSMLLHSPKLAERLLPLVRFFRDESIVEGGLRSLAILASAREHGAAYVWAAQVAAARRNGVREELIDLIRAKGDPGRLPADERDVISFVRQLMRTNRVEAATFDALKSRHSPQWLVELTAAATYFGFVAAFANALEIPAPADGDRLG
jgi:4-carboxymuconolactone decarboxylase